jgi:hypothetical protein
MAPAAPDHSGGRGNTTQGDPAATYGVDDNFIEGKAKGKQAQTAGSWGADQDAELGMFARLCA